MVRFFIRCTSSFNSFCTYLYNSQRYLKWNWEQFYSRAPIIVSKLNNLSSSIDNALSFRVNKVLYIFKSTRSFVVMLQLSSSTQRIGISNKLIFFKIFCITIFYTFWYQSSICCVSFNMFKSIIKACSLRDLLKHSVRKNTRKFPCGLFNDKTLIDRKTCPTKIFKELDWRFWKF